MEKIYDNDGLNIYMILKDGFLQNENYEVGMLKSNHIDFLTDMEIRSVNGMSIPYYNVSGLVEFKSLINMGSLDPDIIINLIKDILSALSGLSSYLLVINSILLDEDFIFYNIDKKTFSFIYLPGYKQNVRSQIRILIENCMRIMRHENAAQTAFVYDLYEKCAEENFDIGFVRNYIDAHDVGRQEEMIETITREETYEEDIFDTGFNVKEKLSDENNIYVIYKVILAVSAGITLFFGAGNVCLQYYKMNRIYNTKPLIGVLLLLAAEIFVYFEIVKQKEQKKEKEEKKEISIFDSGESPDTQVLKEEDERILYKPTYVLAAYGNNANEPIYVNQNNLVIGRGSHAGYCLKNESVSRSHAKIYELNNQLVIEDLDSTNGTFVNNYPIRTGYPAVVFPGDIIRFGSEEYQIQYI